jgi:hypothetical protein
MNQDEIAKTKLIVNRVDNDKTYYIDHHTINPNNVMDDQTISVVMTTHQRTKQTIFTLDTISFSSIKNIQVIIVDDSPSPSIDLHLLDKYTFRIDYVIIKNTRDWLNPCVNYNIGFTFVRGTQIVIQNAEVCHVGDVLKHVSENCFPGSYLVYDAYNLLSFDENDTMYGLHSSSPSHENLSSMFILEHANWYQHHAIRRNGYHFLAAIHVNDFDRLNSGFDYDFALGLWYDDDELYYRIKNSLKLNIKMISHETDKILGIHQYHEKVTSGLSTQQYRKLVNRNKKLFQYKKDKLTKENLWEYFH